MTTLFDQVEVQEKQAQAFGFYWEQLDQLIEQITSECREIEEAYDSGDRLHLEEEVGDLLQATISLAIFCKISPSQALQKSCDKFQRRFERLVALAKADGHTTLHGHAFSSLLQYWERAKNSLDEGPKP